MQIMDDKVSVMIGLITNLISSRAYDKIQSETEHRRFQEIQALIDDRMNKISSDHRDYFQEKALAIVYSYYKGEALVDDIGEPCGFYISNDENMQYKRCIEEIERKMSDQLSWGDNVLRSGQKRILHKMDEVLTELQDTNKGEAYMTVTDQISTKFSNNQKDDFLNIWKGIMFLNKGEEDNEGLTLENLHVVPDYRVWSHIGREMRPLDANLPLENKLQDFFNNENKKGMIIFGAPGIGKSSMVNYIAGHEEMLNKYRKRFIYIQAQNLDATNPQKNTLLDMITSFLKCTEDNLENCVCILDGLDEILVDVDLNQAVAQFMSGLTKIKMKAIITTRDNIIDYSKLGDRVVIIELKLFGYKEIEEFSRKYKRYRNVKFDIQEVQRNNKDVLGIPLLLYIVHALDLQMSDAEDKCRLYNKVFSEIYDKCRFEYIDQKDGITKESNWGMPVVQEVDFPLKEQFDTIAQTIAFEIFKDDKEWQSISKIGNILNKNRELDDLSKKKYPMSNFYHIGKNKIKFYHRSFYEYFLSEFLFSIIINIVDNNLCIDVLIEKLIKAISENYINDEVKNFLEYKIASSQICSDRKAKRRAIYHQMENITCSIMEKCEHIYMSREKACIFFNILLIFNIFHKVNDEGNYKEIFINNPLVFKRLLANFQLYKRTDTGKLNLQYMKFVEENLCFMDFSNSDLSNSFFHIVNLNYAKLSSCNIKKAQFNTVILTFTIFYDSILIGTVFLNCEFFLTNFIKAKVDKRLFEKYERRLYLCLDDENYKNVNKELSACYVYDKENDTLDTYNNFIHMRENLAE